MIDKLTVRLERTSTGTELLTVLDENVSIALHLIAKTIEVQDERGGSKVKSITDTPPVSPAGSMIAGAASHANNVRKAFSKPKQVATVSATA